MKKRHRRASMIKSAGGREASCRSAERVSRAYEHLKPEAVVRSAGGEAQAYRNTGSGRVRRQRPRRRRTRALITSLMIAPAPPTPVIAATRFHGSREFGWRDDWRQARLGFFFWWCARECGCKFFWRVAEVRCFFANGVGDYFNYNDMV